MPIPINLNLQAQKTPQSPPKTAQTPIKPLMQQNQQSTQTQDNTIEIQMMNHLIVE